MYTEKIQNWK